MYMMTWNEEQRTIYAGIGGVVTQAEAQVLGAELDDMLNALSGSIHLELDATRASRMLDGTLEELEKIRFVCAQRGIHSTFYLEESVEEDEMCPVVRAILESTDEAVYLERIAV